MIHTPLCRAHSLISARQHTFVHFGSVRSSRSHILCASVQSLSKALNLHLSGLVLSLSLLSLSQVSLSILRRTDGA